MQMRDAFCALLSQTNSPSSHLASTFSTIGRLTMAYDPKMQKFEISGFLLFHVSKGFFPVLESTPLRMYTR